MGLVCSAYLAPYLSVWQLEGGLAKQEPGLYDVLLKGLCLSRESICFKKAFVCTGFCTLHDVRVLGMSER